MNRDPDFLYELVPTVYRLRDAERGWPLRGLLRVIAEQAEVVERDIDRLYDNWFIETCDDWVAPYIGALVGYTPVSIGPDPGVSARAIARERIAIPRREVANTIALRRRKGAFSVLEDLAASVAGWPAHAAEFYRDLAVTQNIDYLHMHRGRTVDVRRGKALDALGGPFDRLAHTIDVRRADSARTQGRFNIPEVGLFVWRLKAQTVTSAPAYCYEEEAPNCFLFSTLGSDTQLFANPAAPATEPKLPVPITRRAMEPDRPPAAGAPLEVPFYGTGASIQVAIGAPDAFVDPSRITPADLTNWYYRPTGDQIALDPVLGRLMIAPNQARRPAIWVSYAYGSVADIGGGEYPRVVSQPPDAALYRVGRGADFQRIADALTKWGADNPEAAVIEIVDSGVYAEPIAIALAAGQALELRAANGARPTIRLLNWQSSESDDLSVSGERGSWCILDGLLVTGRGVQVSGEVSGVTLRHCTIVPGWGLDCDCNPLRPLEPSLEILGAPLCVTIEHSILGAISVERDEVKEDPLQLRLSDSILDATDPTRVALGTVGRPCADVTLDVRRCTMFGQVTAHSLTLAEDSLFVGVLTVCDRQHGCVRFCYAPQGSRTPRRYECQPDLVMAAVADEVARDGLSPDDAAELRTAEMLRVAPKFDSVRYGAPTYARLALATAPEIAGGASDLSEMGVYHDLYQPQRRANLAERLAEFTPAGADAGIFFAN